MKKLSIIVLSLCLFLFLPAMVSAQTIYNRENAVIAWDASVPPTCPSGSIINATCPGPTFPMNSVGVVRYRIYKRSDLVSLGTYTNIEVTTLTATVHMTPGMTEYIGVEAEFYGAATPTVGQTSATKAWSNVAADCSAAGTFGFLYQLTPNKPGNLRFSLLELIRRGAIMKIG